MRETAARMPNAPAGELHDISNPRHDAFIARTAFDVSLVLSRLKGTNPTVVDMGGGMGLLSTSLAKLGMNSVLIEDFARWGWVDTPSFEELHEFWRSHGVQVIDKDLTQGIGETVSAADAITSFHFLEHLHASPKHLFHEAVSRLTPGGTFVVAGPNCVNLRKRLTSVFGRAKWSPMEDWYERPVFNGHVREPDVDDLLYIGRDLGLEALEIHGRNYLGRAHSGAKGVLGRFADPFLRLRPTLCSDIYLVGEKR